MAVYTDFDRCIKEGVTCSVNNTSAKYIEGIGKIIDTVNTIAEDNYCQNDSGTIGQSIEIVRDFKSALEQTGLFFQHYPEYRTKFDTVMGEMQTFKNKKTGINSDLFWKDLVRYNNSLYAAKVAYEVTKLASNMQDYNEQPYKLREQYKVTRTLAYNHSYTYTTTVECVDHVNNGIRPKTGRIAPVGGVAVPGTAKYDKISISPHITSVKLGYDYRSDDVRELENCFKVAKEQLNYRQKKLDAKLPNKPNNT